MDIASYTLDQLKVLAYDTIAQIEFQQSNLKVINDEIVKKSQQSTEPQEDAA